MKITSVSKIAKKNHFKVGDELTALGGYPVTDILDYQFFDADDSFSAEILRDGKNLSLNVKKPVGVSLGLDFDEELEPRVCKNNCIFCFVSQLPKGLRKTLYLKDDDYRYSFASGSYVTLTNLTEEDIERILRLHLSPLYISVHAYDAGVRRYMVKNPASERMFDVLKRFAAANIRMHTQIVLCKGVNDGAVLEQTITELAALRPQVESLAIVPVGLTCHRQGLTELEPLTVADANEAIRLAEDYNRRLGGFVWCADEMYLRAGLPIPDYGYYGAFPQIENGVGLIAEFRDELGYALDNTAACTCNRKVILVTGVSFGEELSVWANRIQDKFEGLTLEVCAVENLFFGSTVTVAGLVVASDIERALKGKTADAVVIPHNMLKEFETVFLDDISVDELSKRIGMPIKISASNGGDLVKVILEQL